MARCPECRTENPTPTRTWRVLDEPTKQGRFSESSVGIFHCSRCGVVFPQVTGRRRLAIVDADEYVKLKNEVEEMRVANSKLREDVDVANLQAVSTALEKEVVALKREKEDLEARLRLAAA